MRRSLKLSAAVAATLALSAVPVFASVSGAGQGAALSSHFAVSHIPATTTPIKHVVVIFGENVSFDHYFGTYPNATNPAGEPPFYAAPGTPSVNGLTPSLLSNNPNGVNPQRLGPSQAMTGDMDHGYSAEQKAFDNGLMDNFVNATGHGDKTVMDYYDGNTVTALWNYAQHFAMSDESFGTTMGPSSPGAINLISGQTHGAIAFSGNSTTPNPTALKPGDKGYPTWALNQNGTLFSDVDPYFDKASKGTTIEMTGKNIGDLLNAKGITWGWFEGGFANPTAQHKNVGGKEVTDYIPHHEPFQFYASTSNPNHLPPSSVTMIGKTDQANHQYDMTNFWQAVNAGNMPAVSFLKAPGYQDAHAGYSDPLDEQQFVVDTINKLEQSPDWSSTAVIINYDDSDGWYDHVMSPIINGSNDPAQDVLGMVNGKYAGNATIMGGYQDRMGYGPRLPLMVISPYSKRNYVANTVSDQSSILRFIEDNWNLGRIGDGSYDAIAGSLMNMFDFSHGPSNTKLFLNPSTGEPMPQVTPFMVSGQTYMSIYDIAQMADFGFTQSKHDLQFVYNNQIVTVPFHGNTIQVNGQDVKLDANMVGRDGQLCLPIASFAHVLGASVSQSSSYGVTWIPPQN
ncbi:alkaline phosphatase family protein [Alicyclobacillus ferrooxydans]|uniref:Phospholipase n=1 Tax=Alicyclobacillus ferrooxydans TaxID=471514 RepID=A0A0P9CRM2_9BACL|nr:alkaline phosphatase family protein [Alicyclobacillus ferrooxydans]KPV42127.1 phospholipase [Alicyclobacillus ferrooxydans]